MLIRVFFKTICSLVTYISHFSTFGRLKSTAKVVASSWSVDKATRLPTETRVRGYVFFLTRDNTPGGLGDVDVDVI